MSSPMPPREYAVESPAIHLPDKLYFRISEVSKYTGVKSYVLRYWESEFPSLAPKKSGTGQRLYRRKDIELVLEIKRLLYERRFTLEGARRFLHQEYGRRRAPKESKPAEPMVRQGALFEGELLQEIRRELTALVDLLR